MKIIIFSLLSAVRHHLLAWWACSRAFCGKANWNKQFAPAPLSSVAGMLSKEGPWLSLKHSPKLWGHQPGNSANKLFYPKSLRVKGEKKKKLKWNSSLLSTSWALMTRWSQRHLIKKSKSDDAVSLWKPYTSQTCSEPIMRSSRWVDGSGVHALLLVAAMIMIPPSIAAPPWVTKLGPFLCQEETEHFPRTL